MKKITVLVVSFLMTAFGSMQAMQENPYPAWEFIKNVDNEPKLAQITTLKNLHEFNLICDDYPQDNEISNYIKTLIEQKRYHDLQNFFDAITFPYIPRDLAKNAAIYLLEYVEDMDKDVAFQLYQDLDHACTLKFLLFEVWNSENKFSPSDCTLNNLFRFRLLYYKILEDQRYVEYLIEHGHMNLTQDDIRSLRIFREIEEFECDPSIICPQIKMLAPVISLRLTNEHLQRIPAWIECIDSLEKIYVTLTAEIPEALHNHPRIKIFSYKGLLLNG